MLRGEIRLVDLDPAFPGEADKLRPCVVVSNDAANLTAARLVRGVVTVVPLTTATGWLAGFHVLLPASRTGLHTDSKAQAEQVRSVSFERVGRRVGVLDAAAARDLDDALRLHLDL